MKKRKNKFETVYLSGPIEAAKDYGGGWRSKITPKLHKMGFIVHDPSALEKVKTGYDVDKAVRIIKKLKKKNKKAFLKLVKRIQDFDIKLARESDFLIVYMPSNIISGGTVSEIWDAFIIPKLLKTPVKPIFLVTDNELKVSSWVLCTVYRTKGKVFSSFYKLLNYLRKIKKTRKP